MAGSFLLILPRGLGTACYGLTRGLSHVEDLDVLFVVPKAYGDEDQSAIKLVGANNVSIRQRKIELQKFQKEMDYIEVDSHIIPYVDPEDYWKLTKVKVEGEKKIVQTNEDGKIDFSGKYGANLLQEIANYGLVASVIAQENEFDVIHAHDWLAYPAGIAAKEASANHWWFMFTLPISTVAVVVLTLPYTISKEEACMLRQGHHG